MPLDDAKTYELLHHGETNGVFQFESSRHARALRTLPARHRSRTSSRIIALYRPGPLGSGMVDDFIERKHGRK